MKIVVYYRVSTRKQQASGLGIDAQKEAVRDFKRSHNCEVVGTFEETETGKRSDRPELTKAIAACRRHKATLVIAKLDRLARNVAFVANLMEAKAPFVCCDNPTATPLTIHVLAAVAEAEAKAISERTIAALAAAKRRGVQLGNDNLTPRARKLGTKANVLAAQEHAAKALPLARTMHGDGATLATIAEKLTDAGILTRRGNAWSAVAVMRLLG